MQSIVNLDWDPNEPLARVRGETLKSNTALQDYWHLGPARSLAKLLESWGQFGDDSESSEPPTRRLKTLKTWSAKFDWQARIQAATLLQQAADEAEWLARRREVREADWRQAEALRDLADQILAEAPKFIVKGRTLVKGENGEPDREIVTVQLKLDLAIKSIETGSKLARLAAEMTTNEHKLTIALEREIEGIFNIARGVLDDKSYERLLAAITGYDPSS